MGNLLMAIIPPPSHYRDQVGAAENYFIHDRYECRLDAAAFDDRPFKDEFQLEVYQYARQVLDHYGFRRVVDFGCGSGFKLITNFFDCQTVGIELPPILPFLRTKWPGREWHEAAGLEVAELVICSDVIEHIPDPNLLVRMLKDYLPKRLVISTPERDQLCMGTHDGPPRNLHHVREWNFAEFDAYIGSLFQIKEHFVVNGTQVVECTL